MPRLKSRKILIVAPHMPAIAIPENSLIGHVTQPGRIFPSINELKPDTIIFDHTHVNLEKILRRLKSNPFHSKIRIYCYKQQWQPKADSLLQALGVDRFIYAEDLTPAAKEPNAALMSLTALLEKAAAKTLTPNPAINH